MFQVGGRGPAPYAYDSVFRPSAERSTSDVSPVSKPPWQKGKPTSEEETWLDDDTNLVNESCTLELLTDASDYDTTLEKLTPQQKKAVTWLLELENPVGMVPGDKQKHMYSSSWEVNCGC